MASKFVDIAEAAHAESQARLRAVRLKREAAVTAGKLAFNADVVVLRDRILPLLAEAAQACSAVGAPPQLKDNFKVEISHLGAPAAQVYFWCAGPASPPARGTAMLTPTSGQVEFRCYRGMLTMGGDSFERAVTIEGDPRPHVELAVDKILKGYFLDRERVEAGG